MRVHSTCVLCAQCTTNWRSRRRSQTSKRHLLFSFYFSPQLAIHHLRKVCQLGSSINQDVVPNASLATEHTARWFPTDTSRYRQLTRVSTVTRISRATQSHSLILFVGFVRFPSGSSILPLFHLSYNPSVCFPLLRIAQPGFYHIDEHRALKDLLSAIMARQQEDYFNVTSRKHYAIKLWDNRGRINTFWIHLKWQFRRKSNNMKGLW